MDDILIASSNWEEHCQQIEIVVLKKLAQCNIILKLGKSKLISNELQFLGFILTEEGIATAPEKTPRTSQRQET